MDRDLLNIDVAVSPFSRARHDFANSLPLTTQTLLVVKPHSEMVSVDHLCHRLERKVTNVGLQLLCVVPGIHQIAPVIGRTIRLDVQLVGLPSKSERERTECRTS